MSLLGSKRSVFWKIFLSITLLALLLQLFHFGEHIIQVGVWIDGYREAPYMTALGHVLMESLGNFFYPDADPKYQMMMGNEILHLLGNSIFAFGTLTLLFFLRTRLTISAAMIEVFHLYEHVCLTFTAAFYGTAIGMSTLWGLSLDPASLVTLRVWWHFIFNLIPTTLTVLALFYFYKKSIQKKHKV